MCNVELTKEFRVSLKRKGFYVQRVPRFSGDIRFDDDFVYTLSMALTDKQMGKLIDDVRFSDHSDAASMLSVWNANGWLKTEPVVLQKNAYEAPILMLRYNKYIVFDECYGFFMSSSWHGGRIIRKGTVDVSDLLYTIMYSSEGEERQTLLSQVLVASLMPVLMRLDYGWRMFVNRDEVLLDFLSKLGTYLGLGPDGINIDDLPINTFIGAQAPVHVNVCQDLFGLKRPMGVDGNFLRGSVTAFVANEDEDSPYAIFVVGRYKVMLYVLVAAQWIRTEIELPEFCYICCDAQIFRTQCALYLNALLALAGITSMTTANCIIGLKERKLCNTALHTDLTCGNWVEIHLSIRSYVDSIFYAND